MNKKEYDDMVKAMQQEKEGGSSKFWRPGSKKEGKFPIRILPPMKKNGEKTFFFSYKTHFINGVPYECANQTLTDAQGELHKAQPCPVCAFVSKLYNSSERDSDEWKLAGSLKARKRYISRIVVRGKDDETQPEFYEYGPKIWEKLYNILVESEFGNILDAKDGRDFIIHKSGTGRASNYDNSTPSLEKTPIFDDKDKIVKCLTKASEMKYSDLIDFITANELEKVLSNYIHNSDESSAEPKQENNHSAPKSNQNDLKADDDNNADEDVEANEDDEIDDILSEFIE